MDVLGRLLAALGVVLLILCGEVSLTAWRVVGCVGGVVLIVAGFLLVSVNDLGELTDITKGEEKAS